jgi:hypothetical protein
MFNIFKKKNIHKDCHNQQVVTDLSFEMINSHSRALKQLKSKMTINEIRILFDDFERYNGYISLYVESKCKYGVIHNNRIELWSELNNHVKIELQRPQDLCYCISHCKSVDYDGFEECLIDMSGVINDPQGKGFIVEEWS